jgi:hypothetical protein
VTLLLYRRAHAVRNTFYWYEVPRKYSKKWVLNTQPVLVAIEMRLMVLGFVTKTKLDNQGKFGGMTTHITISVAYKTLLYRK